MKKLFGILNLLICFELIVGPNFPGLRIFSVDGAKAETCPSGLVFDSTLNRCITSDQQATLINATASCNGDQECYKRLAEAELKKAEEEGKVAEAVKNKGGLMNGGAKILAIAAPLTIALGAVSGGGCINASGIAMIAGGLAFTVGDMMANSKHKKCLKKIREDWEKKKAATTEKTSSGVTKVSMSQDQSEAFEMLAKTEECMESSAKMKAGFYAASTLAFGASAVLAGIEVFSPKPGDKVGGCKSKPGADAPAKATPPAPQPPAVRPPPKPLGGPVRVVELDIDQLKYMKQMKFNINSSADVSSLIANSYSLSTETKSCASIDQYSMIKDTLKGTEVESDKSLLDYFKMAYAGLKSEFTLVRSAEANPLGAISSFMNKAETRLVLSGILAAMSAMMWQHAKKQARVAANRAEFLRGLKKEFDDANGAISCTSEERNLPSNANCYCYTEAGQRNTARTNSQICQQLFAGVGPSKPGDYSNLDFSNQKVCISNSGQPDENCACKSTRSCMNAIPGTTGNLGLGAISVASNGMKPVNDLANGNVGAGSINGAAALQAAARLLDQKKQLENKAKLNPNAQRKLASQIEKAIMTSGAGAANPLASSQSSLPMNMSPSDAAKALEKELSGEGRSFESINGAASVGQPGADAVEDGGGFSLENTQEQPVVSGDTEKLAEVMNQDFNYNNNDVTSSDSNLFQILSNRYQRSGMRRLFDDEGKTAPEAAAKTDITK